MFNELIKANRLRECKKKRKKGNRTVRMLSYPVGIVGA